MNHWEEMKRMKKKRHSKVGDLVELKDSVLLTNGSKNYLGIIVGKAHNAIKVEWFNRDPADHNFPKKNQFELKLRILSRL